MRMEVSKWIFYFLLMEEALGIQHLLPLGVPKSGGKARVMGFRLDFDTGRQTRMCANDLNNLMSMASLGACHLD
ncbi:hypothetical protein BJY52DRAFT_1275068 [Lactarius psammicola]|nr:hypothetical protein BJY52DRAFT_1275068 [Lactarius psammicola]